MSLPMIEARYLARVCGAAQYEPSSNNNMQIALPFEIVADDEHDGEVITWFATLHGTADSKGKTGVDRVIESLITAGWQGDDMSELADISDDEARRLLPETVQLVLAPDTYEGTTRLKVKWVNRPGAGRAGFKKPLAGGDLKAFGAQMRNAVRGMRGAAGARPAPAARSTGGNGQRPQSAHPNAPGNNDDLPF